MVTAFPTHSSKKAAAGVLCLVALCSTAACGGSSSRGSTDAQTPSTQATTTTTVTKASFLAAGNAICTEMLNRSAEIARPMRTGKPSPSQTAEALDETSTLMRDSLAKLRALPQPPAEGETLTKMFGEVDQLITYTDQMAAAIRAGDSAAVNELQTKGKTLQEKVNDEYTSFGLSECGKPTPS